MKVFVDSNVLLDVIFERKPHFQDSKNILELIGYTSSLIIANCFYVLESQIYTEKALQAIKMLRQLGMLQTSTTPIVMC